MTMNKTISHMVYFVPCHLKWNFLPHHYVTIYSMIILDKIIPALSIYSYISYKQNEYKRL